ncbi:MAG: hypothetical protein GIW94_09665 [Candidatus Eremiobacteraeota bacterium]|nr:hypothetical protein [Candidatus Eremiobacteraeota bacterium]
MAWVHLVALGWLTMVALSVLIHVIPTFTDVAWKDELLARRALAVYAMGVAALVAAFWWRAVSVLPWAAILVAVGLGGYLFAALRTLAAGFAQPRVEAAIARALWTTLASLAVTAVLGVVPAWRLAGHVPLGLGMSAAPIHAAFGIIAWLTVLVMGVSTRTVRPITGARSRIAFAHAAAGSLEIGGVIVAAVGFAFGRATIAWAGAVIVAVGALLYVSDLVDVLRRASEKHRPPQAFLWAAGMWLLAGLALALDALAGGGCGVAALYVLLAGWIGQMVNGHLYHIGIRLIATMARGEEDETPPGELLKEPLSWVSFSTFQTAILIGGLGLFFEDSSLVELAACSGFAGWLAMLVNIVGARSRAIHGQRAASGATISLLETLRS